MKYKGRKVRDAGGYSLKLCGKRCDHDSPCTLPADHDPSGRHESEHGCVFYDVTHALAEKLRTARTKEPTPIPAWLEELERLEKAATRGPWSVRPGHDESDHDHIDGPAAEDDENEIARVDIDCSDQHDESNRIALAPLIVAMRNALPELLALARKHYSSPEEAQRVDSPHPAQARGGVTDG